jgi:hypothetical protein
MRKHQDEAAEGKEGDDTTPDLLLKHSSETFTTYVQK